MKNITVIKMPASEPWKNTGHKSHNSGTGAMKDKRTKRLRTRSAKNRNAIKEYS